MPFELLIDGFAPVPLKDVRFIRELGSETRWEFTILLKSANLTTGQERKMVELFCSEDAVKAKADWNGTLLCPDVRIVGFSRNGDGPAEWDGPTDQLDVWAESTAVKGVGISPFLPRRRVHKANNMLQLFEAFRNVGMVAIERLKEDLEKITFPDNHDKACIIQDGLSDWDFLASVMDQCRMLAPNKAWLPLTLTGGVSEGSPSEDSTSGKWVVVSGKACSYRSWNEVSPRGIDFTAEDGQERFLFGEVPNGVPVPEYSTGRYPSLGVVRPWRNFQAETWKRWRTRDLPLFWGNNGQEMMVWRIQDRLFEGTNDELAWETIVGCLPGGAELPYPKSPCRLLPWIGCGRVSKTDKKQEWITVQLTGFEKGWDEADVRLTTPFSGKHGTRGLHFVPELDTQVELCWPGRFDTSIVLLGNTRWRAADFASPSLFLEEAYQAHYEAVKITKIGDVSISSDLSVAVDATTALKSENTLTINADGADLRMSGGIVHTG